MNGLVIDSFGGDGIELGRGFFLASGGNEVYGNFIGVDPTGTVARGNGGNGVDIIGSSDNTIGGTTLSTRNVISGNLGNGIAISDFQPISFLPTLVATGNVVEGDYVGTNVGGDRAVPNRTYGVSIAAPGNVVGSTSITGENVISGNSATNLMIAGGAATGNVVEGNFIGPDSGGTTPLTPTSAGIFIIEGASDNTIGGTTFSAAI